jgi:predicted membrane-bound spermidine synthase
MYLAWTLGYVGVALVAGTAWPLLLLPVVLVLTRVAVISEGFHNIGCAAR